MAGPVSLVFGQSPLTESPIDLVFGEYDSSGVPALKEITLSGTLPTLTCSASVVTTLLVTVDGTLPAMTATIAVTTIMPATLSATLPALTGLLETLYISGASRPTVGQADTAWQVADKLSVGTEDKVQDTLALPVGVEQRHQSAARASAATGVAFREGDRAQRATRSTRFQQAARVVATPHTAPHTDADRGARLTVRGVFQNGKPTGKHAIVFRHQDALRGARNWAAARWQKGARHSTSTTGDSGPADLLNRGWQADHQEAMRPPAGTSPRPTPETPEPCYTPPDADAVHLLFDTPWSSSTDLVFVCENHGPGTPGSTVVVPIRRAYVVLNETSLRRVDGNIALPTFDMSMSLDVDSWTWSFSASLPGAALADLQPSSPGEPILVEVMINGAAYRMLVERRARERTFANDGIKISGKGIAAILDGPHSASMNFGNENARTALQLMNDVLTDNGVSIGWDVDWRAVDWSVPAGVFSHQGSYMSALNAIAAAAGSYIQPHPTEQTLIVLPRYPDLPWAWDEVVPDFEIPAAVSTVEGIEWIDKALYNRVFVSGIKSGVLGQVTRGGTDGGLVAPMVTDPLITTEAAARQRGTPVLCDTGSQAHITLRMPVLEETGIIVPGKYVDYVADGVSLRGIARSVSVSASHPEVWQTLVLETHV